MAVQYDPHMILSKKPEILCADVGGELALMSAANGKYYILNSVASDIWRMLDSPTEYGQLARVLTEKYDGDPAVIQDDLGSTIEEWATHRLIDLAPASTP